MNNITNAQIDFNNFEEKIKAIDTHTQGEFTRIIIDGFPQPTGNTMIEKMHDLEKNFDYLREALMNEPRGHKDMFGALITTPINPDADFGVIFMESIGYISMCGHGTIGCATAAIEAKLVPVIEPYTYINIEAPAGLIKVKVKVESGRAIEVSLVNVPSFVYKENLMMEINGKNIKYDIAFGGNFFAMVDVCQFDLDINEKNVSKLTEIGIEIINKVNDAIEIKHPNLDITKVDICELYGPSPFKDVNLRNIVIFGDYQADRSPCGTGTSAKLAMLYKQGKIEINEEFIYESFIGSRFKGVILEETKIGDFQAIIPEITGSANLTGIATYLIDPRDRLKYGFRIG